MNWKQALAGAGITLMSLGTPQTAQAQNFGKIGNKIKVGITTIQNKINPQQKVDTIKVQKDTPLQLAKFKDYKGAGYGYAKSPSESTAYKIAKQNATKDLLQKIGQEKITAGIEEKAVKRYQNPDGSYEVEVLLVIGNM